MHKNSSVKIVLRRFIKAQTMINTRGYTNFVPDPDKKPSSLDKLDWMLEDASSQGKEVYILAMSRENYKNPDDATKSMQKVMVFMVPCA